MFLSWCINNKLIDGFLLCAKFCTTPSTCIFSSCCCCLVAQLSPALCDLMDCGMPGFSVSHCLPDIAQTHVHWVHDAIQPLILCCSLLLLPSFVPSIRVFVLTATRHPLHAFSDCVEYGTVMIPFYQCRNLSFRKASVLSHYYTSGTGIPAQVCSQLSDGTRWFQLPLSFSS